VILFAIFLPPPRFNVTSKSNTNWYNLVSRGTSGCLLFKMAQSYKSNFILKKTKLSLNSLVTLNEVLEFKYYIKWSNAPSKNKKLIHYFWSQNFSCRICHWELKLKFSMDCLLVTGLLTCKMFPTASTMVYLMTCSPAVPYFSDVPTTLIPPPWKRFEAQFKTFFSHLVKHEFYDQL